MDRNNKNKINFIPYNCEDRWGLAQNENYHVFKWVDGDILFSVARLGDACTCHFAAKELRPLKKAIDEFVEFVFYLFDWCTMVLAIIEKPSVKRLVVKCGFNKLNDDVYMKVNHGKIS